MNFEDIKNMNKKEFEQFMFNIQSNNKKVYLDLELRIIKWKE